MAIKLPATAIVRGKFVRATRPRTLYYSIVLPEPVGFTDQIILFGLLYKLGTLLGLKYHFTPLQPKPILHKSGPSGEFSVKGEGVKNYSGIFEFLGFDWYFSRRSNCKSIEEIETIEFNFTQATFDENNINDLQDLINYLRELIRRSLPAQGLPLYIRFKIQKQFPDLVWLHKLPNSLLDYDFNNIYQQFGAREPFPDVFEKYKPKILLHSRQGDTSVIQTPWNTFVQIWESGRDPFNERQSIEEVRDHEVTSVADFETFYAGLKSGIDEYELSTLLHSDGFVRAFFQLDRNTDKLNLGNEQKQALDKYREHYDEIAFADFRHHPEVKLYVGEDLQLLFGLMHAFFTADIVIVGTQQRMLAKQYAHSFRDGTGPLLITLYKRYFPYYNYLGNPQMLRNCLYVDLNQYNISDIVEEVRQFLAGRYTVNLSAKVRI